MKRQHEPFQPQSRDTQLVGRDDLGWVGAINQGRRKPDQQDSLAWWTPGNPGYSSVAEGYLFIVADGVGGGTGGAAASYAAAKTIVEEYNSRVAGTRDIADLLTRMIRVANREVFALSNGSDMATTCACLAVRSNQAVVAWVGDSRIYCLRAQNLEQWTTDHSWAIEHGQRLVASGAMAPEDLATSKNRHQITRALGIAENVEPSVLIKEVLPGDRLLVCSDGLWDVLPDESIREQLGRTDLDMKGIAAELVAQANRRGGRDNISLFFIDASTILATQERLALEAQSEHTARSDYGPRPPEVSVISSSDESVITNASQYPADDELQEGVYRGSTVQPVPTGSIPQEARADIVAPPQPAFIPPHAAPIVPATDATLSSWGGSSAPAAGSWGGDPVENAPASDQFSMQPTSLPSPIAPIQPYTNMGINSGSIAPNVASSQGGVPSQYRNWTGMPDSGEPRNLPDAQNQAHSEQAARRNSSDVDSEWDEIEKIRNQPSPVQQQIARPQSQSPDPATRELSAQELEAIRLRQLSIAEKNFQGSGSQLANQSTPSQRQQRYESPQAYDPAGAHYDLQIPVTNLPSSVSNMTDSYNAVPGANVHVEDDIPLEEYDETQDVMQRRRQRIVQQERARKRPLSQVPMFAAGAGLLSILLTVGLFVVLQRVQQPSSGTATPTPLAGSTPTIPVGIVLTQTQTAQAQIAASMTAAVTITSPVTPTIAMTITSPVTPTIAVTITSPATLTVTPTLTLTTGTPTVQVADLTPTTGITSTEGPQPTTNPLFAGQQSTPVANELRQEWVDCVTQGDCGTYINHSNDPSYLYENQYWIMGDLYLFWFTDMASEQDNPAYFSNAEGSLTQAFAQRVGLKGRLLGNPISQVMSFTNFTSLTGFTDEQALLTKYMKDQQQNNKWETSSLNVQFFSNGVVACSDIRPPQRNNSPNVGDCDLLNIGTLLVKKYPDRFCPARGACDGQGILEQISPQKGQFDEIVGSFQGMTTSRDTAVYEKFALTRRSGEPVTFTPLGEWLKDVLLNP
jgi:serine/threonine protein phosphatase PrpC